MSDRGRKPPPHPLAGAIDRKNAETQARAEAEGLEVTSGSRTMNRRPGLRHPGLRHPVAWDVLLRALDTLDDTPCEDAAQAARALDAMLGDPSTSAALVAALVAYGRAAEDPVAGARRALGDNRRLAEGHRISAALRRLRSIDQDLLAIGGELRLSAIALSHREGSPTTSEMRDAVSRAWQAVVALEEVAARAERAAPATRGRQPDAEVRAREALAEALCLEYIRAGGWGADDAFWQMVRAIWEASTGETEIPGLRSLKKKLSDRF